MGAMVNFFKRRELVAVATITFIGCCFVYGRFLLGQGYYVYVDSASDTADQYIPFYVDVIHSIQDGTFSFWNFNYGLGSSLFINQTWTFDVFNLILIPGGLLFGSQSIPFLLVLIQCIRIILCGILFDRLLLFYCYSTSSRILGSALYAFSGFMMLWGQHYWFASAPFWLALVLLLLERAIQDLTVLRSVLLSVSVAGVLIWSLYLGYMILLFALFYFLIRTAYLPERFSLKRYLRRFALFLLIALSGLLMSCIVAIPVAECLLGDSSRIVSDNTPSKMQVALASFGSFVSIDQFGLYLGRLMSNNLIGLGYSDYPIDSFHGGLHAGCSAAVLLLFPMFMAWVYAKAGCCRRKALLTASVLLVLLYMICGFLPQMFYLFSGQDYRSSFVIVPAVCLMIAFVVDRSVLTRSYSLASLTIGFVLSVIVLVASYVMGVPEAHRVVIMEMGILCVVLGILVAYLRRGMRLLYDSVLLIVIASSFLDGYITTNWRLIISDDAAMPITELSDIDADTLEAISFVQKEGDGLYRTEKAYFEFTPAEDSFVQNYIGVSSYNSTLSSGIERFYREMLPHALWGARTDVQCFYQDYSNLAVDAFLGVRYILSTFDIADDAFMLAAQFGDVRVYELGLPSSSIGHLYDNAISAQQFESMDETQRRNMIDTVVIDDAPSCNEEASLPSPIDLSMANEGEVKGAYQSDEVKIAAISIPYNRGWQLYVDGNQAEIEIVNYGFIGFEAPAGEHAFTLIYEPYGWQMGACLSLAGLLLLGSQCLLLKRRKCAQSFDDQGVDHDYTAVGLK